LLREGVTHPEAAMKRLLSALLLGTAAVAAGAVDPASVQAALARNGCQGCHELDARVNGPSYHEIAAKYLDKPDARSYLAGKIRNGSANTWGAAAMPPTAGIDELDLKNIVDWLVAGAPAR
jgi:cytochrome c